jgi:hypothetical protein
VEKIKILSMFIMIHLPFPPIYGLKIASTVSVKNGNFFVKIAVISVILKKIKDKEWYVPIFSK